MKIRAIINGVSVYTTPTAIKRGIGDYSLINTALQLALTDMGTSRGIGRDYHIYDSKMRKSTISVQLSIV